MFDDIKIPDNSPSLGCYILNDKEANLYAPVRYS